MDISVSRAMHWFLPKS